MPDVCNLLVNKLVRLALQVQSRHCCSRLHTIASDSYIAQLNLGSISLLNAINKRGPINFIYSTEFTRYTSTSSKENNQDGYDSNKYDSNYSSSARHQRRQRHSYEQKKSNGQNANGQDIESNDKALSARNMTHYQRLNIEPDADSGAIKSAYYSLSKVYHPDIVGDEDENAAENFRLITESYNILSDSKQRNDYDDHLQAEEILYRHDWSAEQKYDPNLIFRTRDADMIFRAKQEMALQRERQENPQKFRAGTFAIDHATKNVDSEIAKLWRSIHEIDRGTNVYSQDDSSSYYRIHLRNTLIRRYDDLHLVKRKEVQYDNDPGGLSLNAGIILSSLGILILFCSFYGIDIPAYLDDKLTKSAKIEKQARPSDSAGTR